MEYLTAVPAYGRDYKSAKEVKAAWDSNVDFQIVSIGPDNGRYINKQDAETYGKKNLTVNIRYAKLTKVAVIKVK